MAFNKTAFQPIGGQARRGTAPQMFSYMTTDSAATVDTAGYFNEVAALLGVGDLIYRVTLSAGALSTAGWHVVKDRDVAAGTVDVVDTTALTVTDTD